MPRRPDLREHRQQVLRECRRVRRHGRPQGHATFPSPTQARRPVRIPQLHPARLCYSEGLLRPPRDRLALSLGGQRHDPDGQVIRLGHVDSHEPHPAVPEGQQEGGIAAQPVQLGNDQRRAGDLRQVQRLQEFRPVGLPPAFHLGEPRQDVGTAGCGKVLDHLALCFKAKPAGPLSRRRHPLVGHQPLHPRHVRPLYIPA